MNEAQIISEAIQQALPNVRSGTLRFWGNWFGRPHDNVHKIVSAESKPDILRLHFEGEERLTVWHPKEFRMDTSTFQIEHAERVLWQWYYYGRPKAEANLLFYNFLRSGKGVVASSNVNWYTPDLKTNLSLPAVQIL